MKNHTVHLICSYLLKELNCFYVVGFFVDVNVFKGKEKTTDVEIDNDSSLNNTSSSSVMTESLADEDTNLMIKLKFLTYKVNFMEL